MNQSSKHHAAATTPELGGPVGEISAEHDGIPAWIGDDDSPYWGKGVSNRDARLLRNALDASRADVSVRDQCINTLRRALQDVLAGESFEEAETILAEPLPTTGNYLALVSDLTAARAQLAERDRQVAALRCAISDLLPWQPIRPEHALYQDAIAEARRVMADSRELARPGREEATHAGRE